MITFGTDCTGIDAAQAAIGQLGPVDYVFASDIQPHIQDFLLGMDSGPTTVHKSVAERVAKLDPVCDRVDLYVAGFPCQAFSALGKRNGFTDERGTVFFDIFTYLQLCEPSVFVLENVTGLIRHDDGRTFGRIQSMLSTLSAYRVHYQIISPTDLNFPQSRKRIFIVGVHDRLGCQHNPLDQVKPLSTPIALEDVLQSNSEAHLSHPPCMRKLTAKLTQNLRHETDKHKLAGIDVNKQLCVLDIGASKNYRVGCNPGTCPCLKTYSQYFYITTLQRYITPIDALRIQGFDNAEQMIKANPRVCASKWYFWAGNSMCVPLLREILHPIITLLNGAPR